MNNFPLDTATGKFDAQWVFDLEGKQWRVRLVPPILHSHSTHRELLPTALDQPHGCASSKALFRQLLSNRARHELADYLHQHRLLVQAKVSSIVRLFG